MKRFYVNGNITKLENTAVSLLLLNYLSDIWFHHICINDESISNWAFASITFADFIPSKYIITTNLMLCTKTLLLSVIYYMFFYNREIDYFEKLKKYD